MNTLTLETNRNKSAYWANALTQPIVGLDPGRAAAALTRFSTMLERTTAGRGALLGAVSERVFNNVCEAAGIDPRNPAELDEDPWQVQAEARAKARQMLAMYLAVHSWCDREAGRLEVTLPRGFYRQPYQLGELAPSMAEVVKYAGFIPANSRGPQSERRLRYKKTYALAGAQMPELAGDALQRLRNGARMPIQLLVMMIDPLQPDTGIVCELASRRLAEDHLGSLTLKNAQHNLRRVLEEYFDLFDDGALREVIQLKRLLDARLEKELSKSASAQKYSEKERLAQVLNWRAATTGLSEVKEPVTLSVLARELAMACDPLTPLRIATVLRNAAVVLDQGFPGSIHARAFLKTLVEARMAIEATDKDSYDVLCPAIEQTQKLTRAWA